MILPGRANCRKREGAAHREVEKAWCLISETSHRSALSSFITDCVRHNARINRRAAKGIQYTPGKNDENHATGASG
jgi:hypothetical protein